MKSATHFCLQCGTALILKEFEGRLREICPGCGWVNYEHLKLSAGARVENDGRVLLVQRAHEPWQGCWHLPSGYVEVDENPARAAEREVREESGLIIRAGHLIDAYIYRDDPRGNGVILVYQAEYISGEPRPSSETEASGFFTAEEVRHLPLAGESGTQEINDWLDSKKNGRHHD